MGCITLILNKETCKTFKLIRFIIEYIQKKLKDARNVYREEKKRKVSSNTDKNFVLYFIKHIFGSLMNAKKNIYRHI